MHLVSAAVLVSHAAVLQLAAGSCEDKGALPECLISCRLQPARIAHTEALLG